MGFLQLIAVATPREVPDSSGDDDGEHNEPPVIRNTATCCGWGGGSRARRRGGGAGVCAHADEAVRKVEAITAVSLLMDLSPVEVAQGIRPTELLSWAR